MKNCGRIYLAMGLMGLIGPIGPISLIGPMRAAAAEQDTVSVDSETEGVIHGALEYLAKQQGVNGSWTQTQGAANEPVAMTGYALMAFLSTGNLPDEGEYGRNVTSGMQYLLNQIQPDGLFRDVRRWCSPKSTARQGLRCCASVCNKLSV